MHGTQSNVPVRCTHTNHGSYRLRLEFFNFWQAGRVASSRVYGCLLKLFVTLVFGGLSGPMRPLERHHDKPGASRP